MVKCSQLIAINCGRGNICKNDICWKNYSLSGFSKVIKKTNLSRNRKHHEKSFLKTLVVMFSDFWLLIIFNLPLKNLTNIFILCTKFWIYHGFLHCFDNVLFYMFSATLKHIIKQKHYQAKLENIMLCQIWQFHLRSTLKLTPKKNFFFKKPTTLFFKTTLFFNGTLTLCFSCLWS